MHEVCMSVNVCEMHAHVHCKGHKLHIIGWLRPTHDKYSTVFSWSRVISNMPSKLVATSQKIQD
jgi:hypothetical protein